MDGWPLAWLLANAKTKLHFAQFLSLFLDSSRLKNIKNLSRAAASTLCLLTFFF